MARTVSRIMSIFVSIAVFFSALFSTGTLAGNVKMPDTLAGEYTKYVNTFVGTGGYPWVQGNTFPGAVYPFGAVKLSPDTTLAGGKRLFNWGTGGYHTADSFILGFSHTRLSGTGALDMGHFRVTPNTGGASFAKRLTNPLIYSHNNEVATAGYYAVNLPSIGCLAEMTASEHVGVHRYTFRTDKDAHLWLDATSFLYGSASDGEISVDSQTGEISGEALLSTQFAARYGGLKAYFVACFNRPFESFSTWCGSEAVENRASTQGNDCGADINFGNIKGEALEMKLAISFVSVRNARENLNAESDGLWFDEIRTATRNVWESYLSRAAIESSDEKIKTNFYTALYHSMIIPSTYTDVNGEYAGFKNTTGVADGFTYRSDMSLWDTFRTTHPLYTLIAPEIQKDCLNSLVCMAKTGGLLPRWPSGTGYTGSMFGSPANMVISESYLKGITDFDYEAAYEYMKKGSDSEPPAGTQGRKALTAYNQYHYVPADMSKTSVSYTLEYCWADWSLSLMAQALGKTEDASRYSEKAMWYKNLFDTETKYFRGKNSDGTWYENFNPNITSFYDEVLPKKYASPYCEGSAKHWRWTALQDTQGLIELMGGREAFVSELNSFMKGASAKYSALDPGAGYWIGNEHDMHTPYLFNEAGRADLTQKWVRWTLAERFDTTTNGLDGNDDGGAVSSWYVLSAIGIYPVAGTDRYWLGSPNVDSAQLNLGNGKTLNITALNQSEENIYVSGVTLNGEKITGHSITHSQIANGGELVFTMSPTAS